MPDRNVTRRRVLQTATAGSAALLLGGEAAAKNGPQARIVGTASQAAERAAKDRAESVKRVLDFGDIGKAVAGRFSDEAAERLSNRRDVRYVETDGTMHAIEIDSSDSEVPWGVDRVDAEKVHDDGETGGDDTDNEGGAKIAIVDTGIDSDHPDLDGNLNTSDSKAFVDCGSTGGGCRFGVKPNDNTCNYAWDDDNDHGTHVSGTADAEDNGEDVVGVSTAAELVAVKVLDGCGSGSYSDVAAGIKYAADSGCDVANMSLGGDKSSSVEDAVEYADGKGTLLVAAAGNDGPCTDCVGYPAAEPEVIAVSATTKDDTLADFSSQGPEIELAAPGKDILSTVPPESSSDGLDTFSGTSMASPHVAGAGGQLMDNDYTNTEARTQLKDTAEDIGLASEEQGSGLLDVEAALGGSSSDTSVAVSTGDATSVGTSSATLNGTLDDLGGASSADVYFEYGESGTSLDQTSNTKTLSSTGSFSIDVSSLSSGTDYDYRAVADASDGDTDTGTTKTFTTDSSSGGDTAPEIDTWSLTNDSNPAWTRYYVDWDVSDDDGDLSSVTSEMLDSSGNVLDSDSSTVSGSSASGTHYVESKGSASDIRLTVTDVNGNSTTSTKSI